MKLQKTLISLLMMQCLAIPVMHFSHASCVALWAAVPVPLTFVFTHPSFDLCRPGITTSAQDLNIPPFQPVRCSESSLSHSRWSSCFFFFLK